MEIWLLIFLGMSLTLNVLQFSAYINRETEVRRILNMREKLEKAKASLEKTLSENAKVNRVKGFWQGRMSKK